jgi:hypothetical protein
METAIPHLRQSTAKKQKSPNEPVLHRNAIQPGSNPVEPSRTESNQKCGLTAQPRVASADCGPRTVDHSQHKRIAWPQKTNPFLRPRRLAPRYSWSLEFGTLPPVEVNRTQSPLKNFFCSLKPPPAALLFRRAGIIVRRPENVAAVDKVFRVIHERFL